MKRCEFLYVFKDKISIFEKVWALVCSWLSYIQVRNIQGLTPDLVTLFSEVLEKVWVLVCSCSSCYFIRNIQGPTLFQIWQLSHTFWKGVSPCMFLLCIYKGQKYTRSHTFSEKVWVLVCLTIITTAPTLGWRITFTLLWTFYYYLGQTFLHLSVCMKYIYLHCIASKCIWIQKLLYC